MRGLSFFRMLMASAAVAALGGTYALASTFDVPSGDLNAALDAYIAQSGVQLLVPNATVRGVYTKGAQGNLSDSEALSRILKGTGFIAKPDSSGIVGIVRETHSEAVITPITLAQAAPARAAVETVTVTSSKLGGADVQSIPIAITALSQEQLTATQTAGGPDLVKQVPNLTFTKTNFTGYSINIRGIGTQAISVTTDPAVAVALNDQPFIRNHFFEQEFYDVSQVEVLRGPQGTLYGRNATAGVVNVTSARPSDQFEAMASADIGNYKNRRFEGMINIPVVDDRLDIRAAGEWTKRDGYSFNTLTNSPIDGRDLWSGRLSIGFKPSQNLEATLVWEHFQEDDDRIRSSKQLCKTAPIPTSVGGVAVPVPGGSNSLDSILNPATYLSQACQPTSLYSRDAFEVPNGFVLPFYDVLPNAPVVQNLNPYASTVQSQDLRVIESALNPTYKAKNDIVELNANYSVSPSLSLTSQTAFSHDFLWSTQDYNRFNTAPGVFDPNDETGNFRNAISPDGYFCDPQLGCSNRLIAEDLSNEHAWQLSQEFRLSSKFQGPINFSFGGNYLHYETEENYYVFINTLTLFASIGPWESAGTSNVFGFAPWQAGVSDNHECLAPPAGQGFQYPDPREGGGFSACIYIDPNPITNLNSNGHNYFLSQNPYVLNSYAGFGEVYYDVTKDLRLTGGLRWTDDEKHFVQIPSWVVGQGWGYPVAGIVDQQWGEWTGRFAANWTPKLDFTDQTLIYGSFAHGYKAGGANPPGAVLLTNLGGNDVPFPIHPLTFKPEFINAYELGTKNSLFDGGLTLNGDIFYYDYKGYQISQIVDRTSINLNFDATVRGAELEASWEPTPGLKFKFGGGYEDTAVAKGSRAVDLMDRTDSRNHPDWIVVKPFITQASNCIMPVYVVAAFLSGIPQGAEGAIGSGGVVAECETAYSSHFDPVTALPYVANPQFISASGTPVAADLQGYPGFNPDNPSINGGAGFAKDLSNNELPNAPHFTTSLAAEYSMPISGDWVATLHSDFYWQSASWARIFNDDPYDRLHGYTNVNLALIFTSADGWQVLGYLKNVFNTTAITGDFLNSDDSGLTTNVFLTDPRLFGVRVTKNF